MCTEQRNVKTYAFILDSNFIKKKISTKINLYRYIYTWRFLVKIDVSVWTWLVISLNTFLKTRRLIYDSVDNFRCPSADVGMEEKDTDR